MIGNILAKFEKNSIERIFCRGMTLNRRMPALYLIGISEEWDLLATPIRINSCISPQKIGIKRSRFVFYFNNKQTFSNFVTNPSTILGAFFSIKNVNFRFSVP